MVQKWKKTSFCIPGGDICTCFDTFIKTISGKKGFGSLDFAFNESDKFRNLIQTKDDGSVDPLKTFKNAARMVIIDSGNIKAIEELLHESRKMSLMSSELVRLVNILLVLNKAFIF